jgi:tannase
MVHPSAIFLKPRNFEQALPADGAIAGITMDSTSVTANAVYNASVSGEGFFPDATFDYCNVTVAYSHNGRNDQVLLQWWLATPDNFQNRYLTTGGFAYAINAGEGNANLEGGVQYGAVFGITGGGFGGFAATFDEVFLLANDTIDYEPLFMMGYKGIYEQTIIGKAFTQQLYNSSSVPYTYYQSCSEGGRERWSQVQRSGGVTME